jgi:VWFA-related protein
MRMAVALLLIGPAFAQLQTDEFRISTDVYNVLLDVGVRDPKGGYVSHLTKDDFQVEEDGVPQKISSFSDSDVPVTVGLVIDDSGSMRPKRAEVITAGLAFANASNPMDEIFVINFNDRVHFGLPPSLPFSDNIQKLATALERDRPEGRTTLYDAIATALEHLEKGTRDRKALVVVSDGGDNASTHKLPETMRMIEESHATIYTVGLFDLDDPDRNPGVLKRIASMSGGEAFLPEKLDDVIPICKKIAEDIRNRYTIGYVPARAAAKGGRHTIKVTAMAPHHGHLIVQTRTSYVAPPGS